MDKYKINVLKGMTVLNISLLALKSSLDANLSQSVFNKMSEMKILAYQEFVPHSGVSNLFIYSLIALSGAAFIFDTKLRKK